MSPFEAVDRVASATIDAVYEEAWTFRPFKKPADPNADEIPDPDREELPITGVYVDVAEVLRTQNAYDLRTQHRPGVMAGTPAVDVDARDGSFDPRVGDRLVRLKDGTTWRIHIAPSDVDGRRRLHVNGL